MAKSFSNFGTKDLKIIKRALSAFYLISEVKSVIILTVPPDDWAESTLGNVEVQCRIIDLIAAINAELVIQEGD